MTDRVYPSAKPAGNGTGAATTNPTFPATKAQLYSNARPAYRPQASHRRRSRLCSCCLWLTLVIVVLIVLIAIAAAVFYVLYRPQRPTFSVTSLKLSYLNLTSSNRLNSKFDITVDARNPNKKLVYVYNPMAIAVYSGDVDVGDGVIPSFVHGKKNTTVLKTKIASNGKVVDDSSASELKKGLKSKNGLPLKIKLDTKVKVKAGGWLKTPKVGVRVSCDGIRVTPPTGKTPATASTSKAKCKVDVRVKIWKLTF
ncbi:hypothetical protein FEM48_Zijuj01G0281200 [Ziziphus jujuba var. spinosa]|uniref:Late embryogenesis abundant protein LEA-2 subgroup domain-containing protein n=1 Tax=Ziziphus jujuba var. spinosa TaxID=714518 RepID=A0A978W5D8_ZIZJJ|nr:hypothetical protein FEM48_Zijuj01G0281200 [Ziziphus jujuba var. spinosa]